MSNVVNPNFNYTFDGKLTSEIFLEPAIQNPDLLSVFRVIQGINYKQQLNIGKILGKVLKGDQGCGTPNVTGGPVTVENRTLEVCQWMMYLEQCYDTFQETILGEVLRPNSAEPELIGTELGNYIQGLISDALGRDIFRIASFGDTSSGSEYYNKCDGLWTKIIAGSTGYDTKQVDTITSLAAADVKAYFKNLYTGAEIVLKQMAPSDKRFFVTGNIYESLMEYYEGNANAGGFVAREENGVMNLYYRGILVVPIYAWDNWIETDNLGNNSRILYTTPMNHAFGVQEASSLGDMRIWFDPNTDLNKYKARLKLGYNYVHDKLTAYSIGNV